MILMKRFFLLLHAAVALSFLLLALPARAEDGMLSEIFYREDPLFKPLSPDDQHPMAEMIAMAEDGDARAQFILGDLYAKGKGGLAQDMDKARHWFEESARAGYSPSFIRLGALARRQGDMVAAYSFYDLGAGSGMNDDARYAARARDWMRRSGLVTRSDIAAARALSRSWRLQGKDTGAETATSSRRKEFTYNE